MTDYIFDSLEIMCLTLYNEWMNNKDLWFKKSSSYDNYLVNKYYYNSCNYNIINILSNLENINSKEYLIGLILLLDQIPRHYNRINNINVNYYSTLAIKISNYIITKNFYLLPYDLCFIYLPYRHVLDFDKIIEIIDIFINYYNNAKYNDKNIYKSFIKSCINKMYKHYTTHIIDFQDKNMNNNSFINYKWSNFNKILYFCPYNNNINFNKSSNISNSIKNLLNHINNKNIIVSLSGGVDSNVLLSIISNLYDPSKIFAVHINYNNRISSNDELDFVKFLCNKLNINLYYRTIYEINRNKCHLNGLRDLYESSTKNIRFDFYKQIIHKCKTINSLDSVIALGHNKDDCFENIITNISKKQYYENLSGMTYYSYIDNIDFFRPLLDIDKKDIIKYAHNNHIPYLEDSTPSWSARGKIRDNVRPCLEDFDNNIINSFFELKNNMKNMIDIIDKYVIPNIYNSFIFENNMIFGEFEIDNFIYDINIWVKLFLMENFFNFLNHNNKNLSYKSIKEFLFAIKRFNNNFHNININSIRKFVLTQNIIIHYYKNNLNKLCIKFIDINYNYNEET